MIVQHGKLRRAAAAMVEVAGSSKKEAAIVADHLVEANLKGHDSHGVGMLPAYMQHVKEKKLRPNKSIKIERDDGPFIVADGQAGYGQVLGLQIAAKAIARAKKLGIAVAGLHNAHHIGRVGTYGEKIAEAGLISLHFVNVAGHAALVAPHRGTDARYCTNPICLTLPATGKNPPIILDFATSKVALGKVRVAKNKGEQVAAGLLLDNRGQPTTDPGVMFANPIGAALPVGEHKGYGLALFAEIFGAALIGGLTIQPKHKRDRGIINNMLTIVIQPKRLVALDHLKSEIDAVVKYFKASPAADASAPVLVPGDPERIARAARVKGGVPIDDVSWAELQAAADMSGLGARKFLALTR